MKLTTFNLFLILLLVLVISVLICRKCDNIFNNMEEGFTVPTGFTEVHIDKYGSSADYKVYRLTNRYYFDPKNGSLIEVEGTITTNQLTATKLHITARPVTSAGVMTSASTTSYTITVGANDIIPSASMSKSYSSYLYYSKITGENTVVLYVPWHERTFIHIFSNTAVSGTTTQTMGAGQSFYFGYNPITADSFDSSSLSSISLNTAPVENISNYNGNIVSPFYNVDAVYKVTDNVFFDIKYGSLIINKPAIAEQITPPSPAVPASIDIYKHTPTTPMEIKTTQNSIARCSISSCMDANSNAIGFNVRTMKEGENMVIMMVVADKTIVAVLCIDNASGTSPKALIIRNIVRFTRNGTDNGYTDNRRVYGGDEDDDYDPYDLSRYRRRDDDEYWIDRLRRGSLMDDYMLKTQVVPPVCPACPACPARSEICTNCGGNGGNGTLANTGSSMVNANGPMVNANGPMVNAIGQPITQITDSLGNTIVGTSRAAGQAITGTAGAAGKAITGTANVAGNVITGTVGAVGNLASNVVGSATDLLKSTGSGITGLIDRSSSNNQYSSNNQTVLDPYSYQGQLNKPRDLVATNTPAKYLPLTADFSAFGR